MPAKVCVARWCPSSRICPCTLSSPGWYFSTLCSWPPASANSAEKPSPNLGARHEIREDYILDCGNLGPVDPHAALLHVRSHRAQRAAAHHTSRFLLWIRGSRLGLASRLYLRRHRHDPLSPSDDAVCPAQSWFCSSCT